MPQNCGDACTTPLRVSRSDASAKVVYFLKILKEHLSASESKASLLVDLATFFLQIEYQSLDSLRCVRIRRDLPGQLAESWNLYFEFSAFVL
jgi:hypothetical protein